MVRYLAKLPADAVCGNCEYADDGGDKTSRIVDCHNRHSDRFTPERAHVCRVWFRTTTYGAELPLAEREGAHVIHQ